MKIHLKIVFVATYLGFLCLFVAQSVSALTQTEVAKLLPSDIGAGDQFGESVAVSGTTAVIGAPGASDNGSILGAAYSFVRSCGGWLQQAKLLPRNGVSEERFGQSAAVSEATAVAGAYGDNDISLDSGSAHIFSLSKTARSDYESPVNNH